MAKRKSEPDQEQAKIGHNSQMNKTEATAVRAYNLAHDHFDEQRASISFERRELRKEMRDKGYDLGAFDEARRRVKREDGERFYATAETYAAAFSALGPLAETPLGASSLTRDFGADHAGLSQDQAGAA